ncbi:tetratricopeptide repeat protein [Sphaerisporangium dianthi]|uniref:Tetratricopeptide repeat protein n=1 Tax=Sphaerisporangium dianthi TaxID=1436120 RepID=A0ABV9CSV2_9ACTN
MSRLDRHRRRGGLRAAALTGAGALAAALAVTAAATLLPSAQASPTGPVAAGQAPAAVAPGEVPRTPAGAAAAVMNLAERLKRLPGDHQAWASLGVAYVEQARVTADPSSYARAEEALRRAAALAPDDPAVLTGRAALAAGRHEFADAVRLARRAVAANPYGAAAYGVLADARTQLGDYAGATEAVRRMMDLKPGVASFTRASYDAELRGDVREARRLLEAALGDAFAPEDVAYCRYYLGELALRAGELPRAGRMYQEALRAFPGFVPALAGQARAEALAGRPDRAADGYAAVVARLPLAQYIVEYGEVLRKLGRDPGGQWALLKAQRRLMAAGGVRDDLTWAEFEADHGSPAVAVRHAEAEYARNPNMAAADALAWALHKAGRSREALPYAVKATARGWRNALARYHRGAIEHALGRGSAARPLAGATSVNPRFSPALPALARPS